VAVSVGGLSEEQAGQFGSQARQAFETRVMQRVLQALHPYATRYVPPRQHTQGTPTSVWLVGFDQTGPATLAKQTLVDDGRLVVRGESGELELRVYLAPGMQQADQTVVKISNLPMDWQVQGAMQALLGCAGYGEEVVVQQEYGGDAPAALLFSAECSIMRGDVIMAVVRAPVEDRELRRLPFCFATCAGTVRISVHTAKGERVAPPPAPSPTAPPPRQTSSAAPRWTQHSQPTLPNIFTQAGLREGRGRPPLDHHADLGGRPPNIRTGIGRFGGGPTVSGFVSAGTRPAEISQQQDERDSDPALSEDEAEFHSVAPPASIVPLAALDRTEDFMDAELTVQFPTGPLIDGCLKWLEDQYPRVCPEDRRGLVLELSSQCPALIAAHTDSGGTPPERVRLELTLRAGQWGWHASTSDSEEGGGSPQAGGGPMDEDTGQVVQAQPAQTPRAGGPARQRRPPQGPFAPGWAPSPTSSRHSTLAPPPQRQPGGGPS
jgi:hypothetical protein